MLKKAQVHALPSQKREATHLSMRDMTSWGGGLKWQYWSSPAYAHHLHHTNYHLYFTTDEEIKKGDWILDHEEFKTINHYTKEGIARGKWYKIVATTNPDLWDKDTPIGSGGNIFSRKIGIPKIGTDFIEAFVREQGNIKEVNLELLDHGPIIPSMGVLKLRSNGTVVIHPVKERMWNDEQVIEILQMYEDAQKSLAREWFNKNFPQ